jgi:hypothetical protein
MKSSFANMDKERLREISSKGGCVRSRWKYHAARNRLYVRHQLHVLGYKHDGFVEQYLAVQKFYEEPRKKYL